VDAAVSVETRDPALDVGRVAAWLADTTELRPPMAFTRMGFGQSALTYRVSDAGGRQAVLRRPPLGDLLESAHDMGREHRIIAALGRAGAPVPAALAMCDDMAVTGAPFYVMAHVDGTVLLTERDALALAPAARHTAGLELARTLVTLQAVDLDAAGLGDLVRRTPYAARQLRRWRGQWAASQTRELPLVEELAVRLEASMPAEDATVLVHGDYRLDNLLLGEDGTVAAVLDWELCSAGHPAADVGLALAYWHEAGHRDGLFGAAVTTLPGFPTANEIVAAYEQATEHAVAAVPWFVAFAYWKIAVIAEGVYSRWLANPVNGAATASGVGAAVPRLVQQADAAARAAGF
jgi:aminoglycoside phosphotransferase (APT) family kinase protein